jgi:hypothetical protein
MGGLAYSPRRCDSRKRVVLLTQQGIVRATLPEMLHKTFKWRLAWVKIFLEIGAGTVSKETTDKIIQVTTDTFPPNMTYGEFIDAINKIYEDDPTNAPLPILSIVDVVVMKSKGAPRAQIDARLEAQRAYWNNPPK